MVVCLSGGPSHEPEIMKVDRGKSIQQEVEKRLSFWSYKTPVLIHAPPGMGKTYTVSHVLAGWAKDKGMDVLLIGPRRALTSQAKRDLAKALGELRLLEQLTDEGLRVQEKIGNVVVVTIQRLYLLAQTDPEYLKSFGLVIFDEPHLLLDDALFASCTGYIEEHFLDFFGCAIRLYLCATPEAILPTLVKMETPYTIQVLKFPTNYSFVRPWFFQENEEIIKKINNDKSSAKWLIYMPTIAEGNLLKNRLTCSVRLLNRVEREEDQEGWNTILREEKFEEKVCICTAVVDVGVNFKDPLLRNVTVFSLNPNTIIQFLGRKRRTATEQVNLYVKCPSQSELNIAMKQVMELLEAVDLYKQNYPQFAKLHILPSMDRDLRGWMRVTDEGQFELNPLVQKNLLVQKNHLEWLIKRAKENKGDCCFDKFVASLLRIQLPDRSECWLDPRYSGTAKAEFEQFLTNHAGKSMDEKKFDCFCEQFRKFCIAAHGTNGGKDRTDRPWRFQKIANKLIDLDSGYELKIDPISKAVTLEPISNAE